MFLKHINEYIFEYLGTVLIRQIFTQLATLQICAYVKIIGQVEYVNNFVTGTNGNIQYNINYMFMYLLKNLLKKQNE